MNDQTGFFHLNAANQWLLSTFDDLALAADGSIELLPAGTKGKFLLGPLQVFADKTPWYRLRVFTKPLPLDSHIQIFTYADDDDLPAGFQLTNDYPFDDPNWVKQPLDALDVLIRAPAPTDQGLAAETRKLWIGGVVRSNGQATPSIRQMRLDYGRDTYTKFLPAIYTEQDVPREFLERFLSLSQSVFSGLEKETSVLTRLFDAYAAPIRGFPSWLGWLAGWLAWITDEEWTESQARTNLARAFRLYGKRGTVEGLREYLRLYAGMESNIYEPGLHASLWSLGETSTLGFTTMLAPANAQGAVLDATATLDRSNLATEDDFGGALFDDLAHRFCVRIYCAGGARVNALADARTVLDREKPAHTVYDLCVVEPRMRVGAQSFVGIDTVVAQGPPQAQLDVTLDTTTLAEHAPLCKKEILDGCLPDNS